MNGMNGRTSPILGMQPKPIPDYKFTDFAFRVIIQDVEKVVGQHAGALPMVDPAGFLAHKLVLDKLIEVEGKIDELMKRGKPFQEPLGKLEPL